MLDSATLIDRCKRGDELAWEALVRQYQGRVYSLAYYYVRNAEEARDLAQDIFVRVYQRLGRFEERGPFLPWLLLVARNCCIDFLRRRKCRPATNDFQDQTPNLKDKQPNPESTWLAGSRIKLFYRALNGLAEQSKEIILLKEIQGLTLEEISAMLTIPLGTVKSRSHRARIELAKKIRQLEPTFAVGAATGLPQERV